MIGMPVEWHDLKSRAGEIIAAIVKHEQCGRACTCPACNKLRDELPEVWQQMIEIEKALL